MPENLQGEYLNRAFSIPYKTLRLWTTLTTTLMCKNQKCRCKIMYLSQRYKCMHQLKLYQQ